MGGTESYWVHISRGGNWLGAGFLLLRSYVVTADHCLGNIEPGTEDVKVEFENGEVFPGRIYRRCPEADLALIDVPEFGEGPVFPLGCLPQAGEKWSSPYQPSRDHAVLTGMIDAVLSAHECVGGDLVEAMRLGCKQELPDYAPYSGSPVESDSPDEGRRLYGILTEQRPKQFPAGYAREPVPPVLFATTLREILRRFDCFYTSHLLEVLPSSSGGRTPASGEEKDTPAQDWLAVGGVKRDLAVAKEKLKEMREWYDQGLLTEQQFTAVKNGIIGLHVLRGGGGNGHE
jgi:hypothetical protein